MTGKKTRKHLWKDLEKDTKRTLANKIKAISNTAAFIKDYEFLMRNFASDLEKGRTNFQK